MSAVYEASQIKRRRRTRGELGELNAALVSIVEAVKPATVRQVFYQASVRHLVPKDEAGYDVVQRQLVKLREARVIPYSAITDNVRIVLGQDRWDSPGDFQRAVSGLYRRDYWSRHELRVEVWVEKDALASTLVPVVCEEWGLPLYIARGFSSVTYLENAAASIQAQGKPTVVFVLTDFDPSGIWIAEKVRQELPRRAPGVEVQVERIALESRQIREYHLEEALRPTKSKDSRARGFVERYGDQCCELDALSPRDLRALVSGAISTYADPGEIQRLKRIEELERESMVKAWLTPGPL